MSAVSQFFLMLWKSFIQRKRQWWMFLLELLLPIILMAVIVLVRYAAPPDDAADCHYQPRAMPSAGFAFIQDMACGMDNKCFSSEQEAMDYKQQALAGTLWSTVQPFYSDETRDNLEGLRASKNTITSLAAALDSDAIKTLIEMMDSRLGDLFDDEEAVRRFLVDNNYLHQSVVDALLNSSVNITEILRLTNSSTDIRALACDPIQLSQLLIFPPGGASADEVAREFCAVNDTLVPEIVDVLLEQLNVTAIIDILRNIAVAQGEYTRADLVEDLASLLELVGSLEGPRLVLGDLQALSNLGDWVRGIAAFVTNITQTGGLADLAVFGSILEDLESLFSTLLPDNTFLEQIRLSFASAQAIIGWFNQDVYNSFNTGTVTLGDVVGSFWLTSLELSDEDLSLLLGATIDLQQMSEYMSSVALGGSVQGVLCGPGPSLADLIVTDGDQRLEDLVNDVQSTLCELDNDDVTVQAFSDAYSIKQLMDKLEAAQQSKDIDWNAFLLETNTLVENALGLLARIDPLLSIVQGGMGTEQIWRGVMAMFDNLTRINTLNDFINSLAPVMTVLQSSLAALDSPTRYELNRGAHLFMSVLDVVERINIQSKDMPSSLLAILQEDDTFRTMLLDLIDQYPDQAPLILAKLLDPVTLNTLLKPDSLNSENLCDATTLEEVLQLGKHLDDLTGVSQLLCSYNITSALKKLQTMFDYAEIEALVESALLGEMQIVGEADFEELYDRTRHVITEATSVVDEVLNDPAWSDIQGFLPIDSAEDWDIFVDVVTYVYINSTSSSLVVSLGKQVENSESWSDLAPYVKAAVTLTNMIIDGTRYIQVLLDGSTGEVIEKVFTNLPQLLENLVPLVQDQQKLTEMFSANDGDIAMTLCDYTMMMKYLTSIDNLDLRGIQQLLCDGSVIDMIETELLDVCVNAFYPIEQALGYLSATNIDTYEKNISWEELYSGVMMTIDTANVWYSEESPWLLLGHLDVAAILQAIVDLTNAVLTLPNMSSYNPQIEMVRDVVVSALGQEGEALWDMFMYYMYVYERFIDVLAQPFEETVAFDALLSNSEILQGLFGNDTLLTSKLREVLSTATLNTEKLLSLLLHAELAGLQLCRDVALEALFSVEDEADLQVLEELLCELDVQDLIQALLDTPYVSNLTQVVELIVAGYSSVRLPTGYILDTASLLAKTQQVLAGLNDGDTAQLIGQLEELSALLSDDFVQQDELIPIIENILSANLSSFDTLIFSMRGAVASESNRQLHLLNAVLDITLRQLTKINEETSLQEAFDGSSELLKLWKLAVDIPEIPLIMAHSYNNDEFQRLLDLGFKDGITAFCSDEQQVHELLTWPPSLGTSSAEAESRMQEGKARLCAVDLYALVENELFEDELVYLRRQYQRTDELTVKEIKDIYNKTSQVNNLFQQSVMRISPAQYEEIRVLLDTAMDDLFFTMYSTGVANGLAQYLAGIWPAAENMLDLTFIDTISVTMHQVLLRQQDWDLFLSLLFDEQFLTQLEDFVTQLLEVLEMDEQSSAELLEGVGILWRNVESVTGEKVMLAAAWQRFIIAVSDAAQHSLQPGNLAQTCYDALSAVDDEIYAGRMLPLLAASQAYLRAGNTILRALPMLYDASCSVNTSSLLDLYRTLNRSGIIHAVSELVDAVMKPVPEFDCAVYIKSVEVYIDVISKWHLSSLNAQQAAQCLIDSSVQNLPALLQIDNVMLLLADLADLVAELPSLDPGPLNRFMLYIRMALEAAVQQVPIFRHVEMFVNADEFRELLMRYTDLTSSAAEDILSILQIDISSADLMSLSDMELAGILCDPTLVKRLLRLPDDSDITILSARLCNQGQLPQVIAAFRSIVDVGKVFYELSQAVPHYRLNTTWLANVIEDVGVLLERVNDLVSLLGLFDSLWAEALVGDVAAIEDSLLQLFTTGGIDTIAYRLNAIIEDFKGLVTDDTALVILTDIQTLVDGITSLYFFQRDLDVFVRDIVDDSVELKNYMVNSLGISQEVADSFINARLSILQLSALLDAVPLRRLVCEDLHTVLTLHDTATVTMQQVSAQLCSLTDDQITNIFTFLVDQLQVADLLSQFVDFDLNAVLEEAGVKLEEVDEVISLLEPLSDTIETLSTSIAALQSTGYNWNQLNELNSLADLGEKENLEEMSTLICGRKDAFNLRDSFGLTGDDRESELSEESKRKKRGVHSRRKREEESSLDRWQDYERGQLNYANCIELYDTLQKSTTGQVVWKFIKPFLVGSVYYAPANHVTQQIIVEALDVFDDLTNARIVIDRFETYIEDIKDISNITQSSKGLKDSLNNAVVAAALDELLSGSPQVLLDAVNHLQAIDLTIIEDLTSILAGVGDLTRCVYGAEARMRGHSSYADMQDRVYEDDRRNNILAVILFDDMDDVNDAGADVNICNLTDETLRKHIKYTIRMNNDNVPTTARLKDRYWRPGPGDNFAEDMRYFRGFVQMQHLVDTAIIKMQTHCKAPNPIVETQQMPYPCFGEDRFVNYVTLYVFPIMMVFMWLIAVASATSKRVADRQMALEETMMSMGLRAGVHWLSWFVSSLFVMWLLCIVIVLFLKLGNIYPQTDWGVMIVFLFVFSFSTLMMSYMVSVFFSNAVLATLVAIIVYGAMYLPFFIVIALREDLPFWAEVLVSLACNTAFSNGAQLIAISELRGTGMQWDGLHKQVLYLELTFDYVLVIMFCDGLLYAIIGWYVSNIYPGKYGVEQPIYFPLMPSYWGCGCFSAKTKSEYQINKAQRAGSNGQYEQDSNILARRFKPVGESSFVPPFYSPPCALDELMTKDQKAPPEKGPGEKDPVILPVGISLHHLRKDFGSRRTIHDLDVNIYQEQVTALLGQNGSGKSTAIKMMTGTLPPDGGQVYINGKSVLRHRSDARKDLGVCPQQNILFDYMTVWEHLDFYATLKGRDRRKEREEDIKRLIVRLGLIEQTFVRADQLSGGQKRKLQVAIAFVGGPKVIVLDEPTSGVDSQARRYIWNLIADSKVSRTILLCTHHMDEADILADRVLIMHAGRLLSKGSPLYLKREFGCGYRLTVEKQMLVGSKNDDGACNGPSSSYPHSYCNSSEVLSLLRSEVPEAEVLEERPNETSFILPTNRGQRARFAELFNHLDAQKDELCVASYAVSDTTLEEVFVKITNAANNGQPIDAEMLRKMAEVRSDDREERNGADNTSGSIDIEASPTTHYAVDDSNWNSLWYCLCRCCPMLSALFYKHARHTVYNWRSYLSFAVLPVLLVILAMLCMKFKPQNENEPAIQLAPELYADSNAFFRLHGSGHLLIEVEKDLERQDGMATTCFRGSDFPKCGSSENDFNESPHSANKVYLDAEECECKDNTYTCPDGSFGVPPPERRYGSGIKIYNLTGNQFTTTEHLLRSFTRYIDNRFGGLEMETEDNMRVWYNNKGYHSVAAFQSAVSNLLLRASLNLTTDDGSTDYGITTINHPLPGDYADFSEETLLQKLSDVGIAMILLVAFAFVVAGHSVYLVREQVTHEKRLQLIYGVPTPLYWTVAFTWQLMVSLVPILLTLGVMRAFNLDEYNEGDHYAMNLWAHASLFAAYVWAAVPGMYLLIRFSRYVHNAYLLIFLLNFFLGLAATMCMFLLNQTSYEENIEAAADVLQYVFLVLAPYCLGDGSLRITHNEFVYRLRSKYVYYGSTPPGGRTNSFSFKDGILWHLVALGIQGVVFFLLNIIIEISSGISRNKSNTGHRDLSHLEDSDVSLERQRVDSGEANTDTLVLQNLRKSFRQTSRRVLAVNNLSFGIRRGECFGLLGVNGAGKTTTFNTITGELNPSKGIIRFCGQPTGGCWSSLRGKVGYCPQTNALDDYMTGRALLHFYANLRGIRNFYWVTEKLLYDFGLLEHADMLTKRYSGGTKRKLQAAIAMLANPRLILLDEPTAGIDSVSKQLIWKNLAEALRDNSTIVLTSHSVSECEQLCNRFGFMVNGKFVCLGSAQHLKNKFGHGYIVTIRVDDEHPDIDRVIAFMETNFENTYLKEAHLNVLEFRIADARAIPLGEVFTKLEANLHQLNIAEYSLSQTSIESVFMNFSEQQGDGTGASDSGSSADASTYLTGAQGYSNPAYGTLDTRQGTPTQVRSLSSLRSIPGYRRSEVAAAEDINVTMVDDDTLRKRNVYSSEGFSSERPMSENESNLKSYVESDEEEMVRYLSEPVQRPEPVGAETDRMITNNSMIASF